ncbi:MAG: glycoside hydrolase, partial [Kiritimatiellae bacterium]|nr:glycoside hydrolase [Kiritimatiellia bacterium]
MKRLLLLAVLASAVASAVAMPESAGLPVLDLSADAWRQSFVAQGTKETYEGHPTTLLSDDRRTMFCIWTPGHGGAVSRLARSDDGGRSWTRIDELLPADYVASNLNCPTFQKIKGPGGKTRYFVFSCKLKPETDASGRKLTKPERLAGLGILMSEDDGKTWRELPNQPHLSAAMPPTGLMQLKDGTTALFGQVRCNRAVKTDGPNDDQEIWMSVSRDGGFTWGEARVVASKPGRNLCEPCCLRSPDGRSLALLMRDNRHTGPSAISFSHDEGRTWSEPRDTQPGLTGDRHEAIMLPDGRYFIAFRNRHVGDPLYGQFMAWVGTWDDLVRGGKGQCRVHLLKHHGKPGRWPGNEIDTGYPGVELLPDGTIVCTT